jgi:very-short-patch-repair endonuclease
MGKLDHALHDLARRQHGLVTRSQVLDAGGDDHTVERRERAGRWLRLQAGVYLIGLGPPTWEQALQAACLAAGPGAVVSHRAAAQLWELDGTAGRLVEVTVPYATRAVLCDALMHRSRRLSVEDVTERRGIPVTCIERTLVDLARFVGPRVVEIGMESALRRGLTSYDRLADQVCVRNHRRPGAARVRRILAQRTGGRAAGSPAEVAFARFLRRYGLPDPERQYPIRLRDGSVAVVDFAWPVAKLAVEWDGFDVHSGRLAFARDLDRQNAVMDVGWELRRYTGDVLGRRGEEVAATLRRLLCTETAA